MKYRINKIDVAVNQLDWAIKLFFNEAFVPAIALAGGAEELLGEAALNKTGSSSFTELTNNLSRQSGLPKNAIGQNYLNMAKNWIKHWQGLKDNESIELELETEAIQYIIRAMSNLVGYCNNRSSESLRFLEWLSENRKGFFCGQSPGLYEEFKEIDLYTANSSLK
jgi:hypothetical protein